MNIAAFVLGLIFLVNGNNFLEGLFLGVWLTWSGYILYRIAVMFIVPLLQNFRLPTYNPVEAEMNKLKRMPPEKLAAECEKM